MGSSVADRVGSPLTQEPSAIDRTPATLGDDRRTLRRTTDFDFRRPSKLGRDVLRVLELGHETFARRLSTGWGTELRAIVQVEPLGMDQTSYDDHIRAMPNPNVVLVVGVPPLPGAVVVDCNVQLGIQMVERLLGAVPTPGVSAPRRPSEVEADLIRFLSGQVVTALADTLEPLLDETLEPTLDSIEFNPQLVQVAAPSDTALLLSYRVSVSGGLDASGIVTVAYPGPTLTPLLESLAARRGGDDRDAIDPLARAAVGSSLAEVPLSLSVQLNTSRIPASDIAALRVGDVLRLEHRVDAPARGVVGGQDVLHAHLGRRGARLAVQVRDWIDTPPLVSARTLDRRQDVPTGVPGDPADGMPTPAALHVVPTAMETRP